MYMKMYMYMQCMYQVIVSGFNVILLSSLRRKVFLI